jgi:hypothetical protein
MSVPQILFTYYDQDQTVRWVDHLFLKDGVRQQAKQAFERELPSFGQINLVKKGTINDFFVNGLPQSSYLNHISTVNRPISKGLLPLPSQQGYVRLLVNAYIGNPTLY